MQIFDPFSALLGGALIGLASVLLMILLGRVAGISGILAGCFNLIRRDNGWRFAFIAGLIAAPMIAGAAGFPIVSPQMPTNWIIVVIAGLLVGYGTRLGGGCTSGHGVCGIARLSSRSIIATALFMIAAAIVVAIMRHVLGG
jgi:uncharacterized protein